MLLQKDQKSLQGLTQVQYQKEEALPFLRSTSSLNYEKSFLRFSMNYAIKEIREVQRDEQLQM